MEKVERKGKRAREIEKLRQQQQQGGLLCRKLKIDLKGTSVAQDSQV